MWAGYLLAVSARTKPPTQGVNMDRKKFLPRPVRLALPRVKGTPMSLRFTTTRFPGIFKRGDSYIVRVGDRASGQVSRTASTLGEARDLQSMLRADMRRRVRHRCRRRDRRQRCRLRMGDHPRSVKSSHLAAVSASSTATPDGAAGSAHARPAVRACRALGTDAMNPASRRTHLSVRDSVPAAWNRARPPSSWELCTMFTNEIPACCRYNRHGDVCAPHT